MKNTALRCLLVALAIVSVTGRAATAAQVLSTKSLACGGTGEQGGSITVSERAGNVTLKVRASGLVPGQPVTCGYTCGMVFTNGPSAPCGVVASSGRFTGTVELSLGACFGFIPFFSTPTTGKCVPSAIR